MLSLVLSPATRFLPGSCLSGSVSCLLLVWLSRSSCYCYCRLLVLLFVGFLVRCCVSVCVAWSLPGYFRYFVSFLLFFFLGCYSFYPSCLFAFFRARSLCSPCYFALAICFSTPGSSRWFVLFRVPCLLPALRTSSGSLASSCPSPRLFSACIYFCSVFSVSPIVAVVSLPIAPTS